MQLRNLLITTLAITLGMGGLPESCQAWPGTWAVVPSSLKALPAHPRLFAGKPRFATLKKQNDPVFRQFKAIVLHQATEFLTAGDVVYPASGFKFGAMRNVQGRLLALALSYRLTEDQRFLDRARRELLRLADLPDWAPGHFLDVGEGALAAGVALDWLYNDLTPAERDQIARGIVRNALLPSLEVPEGNGSWVNGDFNWNQVCHGGLVVGALAVAEREPELSRRIIDRAVKNLPYAGAVYAPDGAYPEGPSYWSYGTSFHIILIEALRSALGTSYGLEQFPGFMKTADYKLQMRGTGGLDFNYSDYHIEHLNEPVMLWFARELGRPELATGELADVASLHQSLTDQTASRVRPNRHIPLELLWWDPALASQPPRSLPLHWTSEGVLPLAVMRSAWNDSLATFVAIKGGTPNHSHAHMDVGSFVMEADGIRWAIDLGTENYNLMRAARLDLWNYAQNSTRWNTFRVGPEGHNILRFDGEKQQVEGKAGIARLPADSVGNSVDLTPVYQGQVAVVRRIVRLNADRSVSLTDQWTTGGRAVTTSWQWLTHAEVTKTLQGLLLQQAGKTLALQVRATSNWTIDIEDVSSPRNPQDSPNPDVKRIVIRLASPAGSTTRLEVRMAPGSTSEK